MKQDELPISNLERVGVETIYTDESALWHRTGFRNILYAISITRTLVFAASDRLPWLVLSKLAKNLISCSPFWYESKCLDHIGSQNGWSNTETEKHCGSSCTPVWTHTPVARIGRTAEEHDHPAAVNWLYDGDGGRNFVWHHLCASWI